MAIRELRFQGDDVLRKKSRVVTAFDEKLWTLLDDMAQTMQKENGVGLAAPQVGILRRVVLVDVGEGVIELINPEIVKQSGSQVGQEGCLSLPGEFEEVKRPRKVRVKAQDRRGKVFQMEGEDLLARAFCHEIDHLDGVLFVDHVAPKPPQLNRG